MSSNPGGAVGYVVEHFFIKRKLGEPGQVYE